MFFFPFSPFKIFIQRFEFVYRKKKLFNKQKDAVVKKTKKYIGKEKKKIISNNMLKTVMQGDYIKC